MDFGKVPTDQLSMKAYVADSSASAVMLVKYGEIALDDIGERFVGTVFTMQRIKILKETGKVYGDFYLPYYSDGGYEYIKHIKAIITQPDGSTVKLEKSAIFEEKINEYRSAIRFSLPKVQVGSVLDVQYKLYTKNLVQLKRWYFQEEIPVQHSQLVFRAPANFGYQYYLRGYALGDIKALENTSHPIQVKLTQGKFDLKYVPGMEEEKYLSSLNNYRAHVRFQLSDVVFPGRPVEKYLESWDTFVNEYNHNRYRGLRYIQKSNYSKIWGDFQALIDPEDTQLDKVNKAYKFINSEISWDGYISTACDETLNALYKKKSASSAGLSFTMIGLLRAMDIPAYPVLSGIRENGNLILEAPVTDQFKHTMVYTVIDGAEMVIDMGDKNRPIDLLNIHSLNFYGLVIKEKKCEWTPLKPTMSNSLYMVESTIKEDQLIGKIKTRFTGYEGLRLEEEYSNGIEGLFKAVFPTGIATDTEVSEMTTEHPSHTSSINFKIDYETIDDVMFVYPVMFSDFIENPFKLEKRYYPIEFTYPFTEKGIFKFTIPDGYELDEIPSSIVTKSPDGQLLYKIVAEQKENVVSVLSTITVKETFFSMQNYQALKGFFGGYSELIQAPIVLKKKQ